MASERTTHKADRYGAIRRGSGVLLLMAIAGLLVACTDGGAELASGGTGGDSVAPSTPTGLTANAFSGSQINLSWSPSSDNVAVYGYQVFRNGTLLITLGNTVNYPDTGLTPSTPYTYTVRAFDAAGNVSGQSNSVTRSTLPADNTAPTVPGGLTTNVVSATRIDLSWTASTDNVGVTGYNVYRGGSLIATLGATTSFQNNGLAASTTYSYTVQAFDAAGNASAQSTPPAIATTPTPPPCALIGSNPAVLAWDAVTHPDLVGYRVYYGTAPATYDQPRGTGAQQVAVTTAQVNLTSGTTYYFAVTAYGLLANESAFSNEVCKTIQ